MPRELSPQYRPLEAVLTDVIRIKRARVKIGQSLEFDPGIVIENIEALRTLLGLSPLMGEIVTVSHLNGTDKNETSQELRCRHWTRIQFRFGNAGPATHQALVKYVPFDKFPDLFLEPLPLKEKPQPPLEREEPFRSWTEWIPEADNVFLI